MKRTVKRWSIIPVLAGALLVAPLPSSAGTPQGLKGFEGQPGNQGGGGHHGTPNGLKGFEGQPGNQGGH